MFFILPLHKKYTKIYFYIAVSIKLFSQLFSQPTNLKVQGARP